MTEVADVVVVGAGVAGCATAYFLARDGARVTLVEMGSIGDCASGYAFGLLNPLAGAGIPGPLEPLARESFRMHGEMRGALEEESGIEIQLAPTPHLELCPSEAEIAATQETMRRWDGTQGFSARWLDPAEVQSVEPRIAPDVQGAVLLEGLVMLDSDGYTRALAAAAERHGARVVRGRAEGLRSEGSRVAGVVVGDRTIACGAVVMAMGPWSGRASSWLGVDVPVEPLKGEILRLEGFAPPLRHHVQGRCAVVQKSDGLVWVGSTVESAGFDRDPTDGARRDLMKLGASIVPSIAGLKVVRHTACLRPTTPDHLPIVGPSPGLEGVYLATGAEKKGILVGPAMGRVVADLVLYGKTALPITPFVADRFG